MGAGDFAPSYLERHMLADVGDNLDWLETKNALYINVGLVARKIDETGGNVSAATDLGIDPRTKLPYKRGPYETKPTTDKTVVASLMGEVKREKKLFQDAVLLR
eukprot:1413072-Prymnesium_polylepis.1